VRAIHLAAQAGNPDAIDALLEHDADINARDEYAGRTPLIFATAQSRLETMKALIEAGADVSLSTEVKDYVAISADDNKERQRRSRIRQAALEPQPQASGGQRGQPGQQQGQQARQGRAAAATPDSTPAGGGAPDSTGARRGAQDPPEPDRQSSPDTSAAGRRGGTTGTPGRPGSGGPPPSLSYNDLVGKQGGMTALHYAARDGRFDAARLLVESGAEVNQLTGGDESTPLLVAIINGNYDLAIYLIDNGADPNLASEDNAAPLFATLNNEWALRTWYPQPTAQQQQETTYLDLMKTLLDLGADPNVRVKTHIWYAAYNAGRMGVDFGGATAFWRAAYATDVEAMKLLVAYGADPNIRTNKPAGRRRFSQQRPDTTRTADSTETEDDPSGLPLIPIGGPAVHPIHAASGVGYGTSRVGQQHRHVPDGWLPAVRYLVEELGVDVNLRDHDGYSAVHHAAARGDNAVIEFLVEHEADVTFVSRRGQTTVDMANGPQQRVQPFPDTIFLLESLGAKNNNNCLSSE
jgi:ankyrin repeat protein